MDTVESIARYPADQCTGSTPPGVRLECPMSTTHFKSVSELFGLPSPPTSGRERLVAAAVELFYRNGYGAIGVDRVVEEAGVTKTTFYKHFEGKDDLMI